MTQAELVRVMYRDEPCKTALNRVKGMPFEWTLNPYMGCVHRCTFCYVRAFEKRADRPSDDRYGRSIRVKTNIAEVLRDELRRKRWKGSTVAIGTATDPYQPAEGRYRLTRACIEALAEVRNPLGIITRGPMIIRDLDVLQHAAERAEVSASFSIPTLDRDIWRTTEPGTAPPHQRLRALRTLVDAGINANVGIAPIIPGLSDTPAGLADVVKAARDAGATSVWCRVLHLRPGTREHFMECIAHDWPELLPKYERMYRQAYLSNREEAPVRHLVQSLSDRIGVADRREHRIEPPPMAEQLALL